MSQGEAVDAPAGADPRPVVLVVDDSRVMRVALRRLLADRHEVLEAENGEQAWQTLHERDDIDLVFSDLSMPVLDGYGLLERVRSAPGARLRQVPFIVITGNEDDEGSRARALERGASDFVSKPFSSAEIHARVRAHMRRGPATVEGEEAPGALPGRGWLLEQIRSSLSFSRRHDQCLSLMLLSLGDHAALLEPECADALIDPLARILREAVRCEDSAACIEHGRFALLLPATALAGAQVLAARLTALYRAQVPAREDHPPLGVLLYSPGDDPDFEPAAALAALEARLVATPLDGDLCLVLEGADPRAEPRALPVAELPAARSATPAGRARKDEEGAALEALRAERARAARQAAAAAAEERALREELERHAVELAEARRALEAARQETEQAVRRAAAGEAAVDELEHLRDALRREAEAREAAEERIALLEIKLRACSAPRPADAVAAPLPFWQRLFRRRG